MTEGDRSDPPPEEAASEDLHDLARDWITLWQSELAALTVDREAQEAWCVLLSLWAGAAGAVIGGLSRGLADDSRRGSLATAPRSTPAAAASDAGDVEVERHRERVTACGWAGATPPLSRRGLSSRPCSARLPVSPGPSPTPC
jgi:hypothetical protein